MSSNTASFERYLILVSGFSIYPDSSDAGTVIVLPEGVSSDSYFMTATGPMANMFTTLQLLIC